MEKREWPVERARAKLLRLAADFITDGYLEFEAQTLINEVMGVNHGRGYADEQGFRGILSAALSWGEEEIGRAVAEVYGQAEKGPVAPAQDERAAALIKAIRAITVDMPDDQPNGEAERQLIRLEKAVETLPRGARGAAAVCDAAAKLCEALADDTRRLRIAAEAYFGGDFRAPDAPGADA